MNSKVAYSKLIQNGDGKYLLFKTTVDPEQNKLLDEVLHDRELTLEGFKLLRKKYSGLKSNVQRIEKKLPVIMQQLPEETFIPWWIQKEISSIEKKYSCIEKAIQKYKSSQQLFNKELEAVYFPKGNSHELFKEGIKEDAWLVVNLWHLYLFSRR